MLDSLLCYLTLLPHFSLVYSRLHTRILFRRRRGPHQTGKVAKKLPFGMTVLRLPALSPSTSTTRRKRNPANSHRTIGPGDDRGGRESKITCVDASRLARSFAGRNYDRRLLEALPPKPTRAVKTGSFTGSFVTRRCSHARSPYAWGRWSSAMDSSLRMCVLSDVVQLIEIALG